MSDIDKTKKAIRLSFQEIYNLNAWQWSGDRHPFTCGGERSDPYHLDGEGRLIATETGWVCPWCDYRQAYRENLEKSASSHHPKDLYKALAHDEQAVEIVEIVRLRAALVEAEMLISKARLTSTHSAYRKYVQRAQAVLQAALGGSDD